MKPSRKCDGCKACCYTHAVSSATIEGPILITPLMQHCQYECKHGCGIYKDRPPACKEYECAWLKGEIDSKRPDELGLVIDFATIYGIQFISAMEATPGSSKRKSAKELVRKLAKSYVVCVTGPSTRLVYGPSNRLNDMNMLMTQMKLYNFGDYEYH